MSNKQNIDAVVGAANRQGPSRKRGQQAGMGALGMIFVLIIVAIAATFVIRLVPHYIDFYTIRAAVDGLDQDALASRRSALVALEKQFRIDSIRDKKPGDIMSVRQQGTQFEFDLSYEIREPLFYNVFLVVEFSDIIHRSNKT